MRSRDEKVTTVADRTLRAKPWRAGALSASLAILVLLAVLAPSSASAAASELVFDPTLSLTGDCSTSALDEVPDPGVCPIPPGTTFTPEGPQADHPSAAFAVPKAVTTDDYGNIYVSNRGSPLGNGRIDVFDPDGRFLTEIPVADPANLAVDSEGNLYVSNGESGEELIRYSPSVYEPEAGEIEYADPPHVVLEDAGAGVNWMPLAVHPTNDHLFTKGAGHIVREYGSAAEGNPLIDDSVVSSNAGPASTALALDAARDRIYVDRLTPAPAQANVIQVFDLQPPHELLMTIDGSNGPDGKFTGNLAVAVDEESGEFFVYANESQKVYAFAAAGAYLATIDRKFQGVAGAIGFDDSAASPNKGYLYVPSHPSGIGHSFAFGPPPPECPPEVESLSFSAVTQGDAVLHAAVNPCGVETHYAFHYTTQERFEAEGFAGALTAGEGQIPPGGVAVPLSAGATGLAAGTSYRFHVLATNAKGADEAQGTLTTYLVPDPPGQCPNGALRSGPSATLPDCRAYELVTPSDTNGHAPFGPAESGPVFPTRPSSPDGEKVSFLVKGGPIPGLGGAGLWFGDPYRSTRGQSGWTTLSAGSDGVEAAAGPWGGVSPDQGHTFWTAEIGGTAVLEGLFRTEYVRYPDGHSELLGRGSIGFDPDAAGKLISENGGHIVFDSKNENARVAVQLESNAPPDGTEAIYDRTPDGVTHVVSLLPGDVTPVEGQDAEYRGASLDGEGVAFEIGSKLYLRHDNEATYEIGEGVTFAGVAEGGERIFYLQNGDLKRFDAATEAVTPFSATGNVTPVSVSADGSAAYFVSPGLLTAKPNPNGDKAKAGQENLYLSREGQISFVGTLTERDVQGAVPPGRNELAEGLGLWVTALESGRPGKVPARTTPDGSVLLFESRADLADYEAEGTAQVYRYDLAGEELECLSCNPTGAAPAGPAGLQSVHPAGDAPVNLTGIVHNLRADGRRAFFESEDRLVGADLDGLQDVYEWEAQGVGGCQRPGGCLYLISSGRSARHEYLYAVSDSGEDVFFTSSDLLVPWLDDDETPSIYDARVNGGFPPPPAPAGECLGGACQPVTRPPEDQSPASAGFRGAGNGVPRTTRPRCPRGKRAVRRRGRVRCVPRREQRKRAGANRRAAR